MAVLGTRVPVSYPTPVPTTGLELGGVDINVPWDDRFGAGVAFVPLGCFDGPDGDFFSCSQDSADHVLAEADELPSSVEFEPYYLYDGVMCSTLNGPVNDSLGTRTEQRLRSKFWAAVTVQILTGALGEAAVTDAGGDPTTVHSFVRDATAIASTAYSTVGALAELEMALAGSLGDTRGVVWVSPRVLTLLVAAGALVPGDGRWWTPRGHAVVSSAGHDAALKPTDEGAIPDASEWIWGSGPIATSYSDMRNPTPAAVGLPRDVELARNVERHRRYRDVVHYYEPCSVFAALADTSGCSIDGGGA